MDRESIFTELTSVFRETLDDETLTLEETTTAADVEEWDSVTHVQLMVAVEKKFDIRINMGEVATLANVGQLVDLVEKRQE